MYLFAITLLITLVVISHGNNYFKKCCKSTESLAEVNSTYQCVEKTLNRLDILTNETDFLRIGTDGQCVDVIKEVFIFNVTAGIIVNKRPVNEIFFPKCCPLNYSYNTVLHSCEEGYTVHDYIKETVVTIGLPNCKIIVDYELNESKNSLIGLRSSTRSQPYCIDKNEKGSFIVRECKESLDICENVKCIKKCCPDGKSFINRSQCFDTYTYGLNLSSLSMVDKPQDSYAIISDRTCPKIYMMKEGKYIFHLNDRGVFKYWSNLTKSVTYEDVRNTNSYCIEHVKAKNFEGYLFFMCFSQQTIKKFDYTMWPKILSCIFLILTIVVYIILHESRKVFGKILINYCIALLFENALLTYGQQNIHPSKIDCLLRGIFLIFFSLAAYSWSNVVCYDIWRTFGSTKGTIGEYYRKRVLKKLVPYVLYGWGIPTVTTSVIFLFYNYKILPYSLQPLLAGKKCFLNSGEGNYGKVLFFNLPDLIMQLVNMLLFVKTVIYCLKVKMEINRINDTTKDDQSKKFQKDKEKLYIILKLSIIMGISFTFEVVSAFLDMKQMGEIPKYIEIVWDTVNCLQGVFIFIIFICKKNILRDLLRKFKIVLPRKTSSSSLGTQSTTASSATSKKMSSPETENLNAI